MTCRREDTVNLGTVTWGWTFGGKDYVFVGEEKQ